MTKKNNQSFLQTLMSMFKSKTKKKCTSKSSKLTKSKSSKLTKSKSSKLTKSLKGGMLRDGTVIRNMPMRS